jgi:cell division transport system permease protein
LRSFRFNYTPYYWLTVSSLAVLLLLGSLFVCTFWFSDRWEDLFKENIEFLVECGPGLDKAAEDALSEKLAAMDGVTNLRFVPADDALALMREELGDIALPDTMDNPFTASYRFNLRPEFVDAETVAGLKKTIVALEGVENFYYPDDLYGELRERLRKFALITGGIGGLLVLLILVMIHHQIRMYIMQHRYHIRTMSLVGATRAYIRKPFIAEVLKMSSFSILVAAIGFLLVLLWIGKATGYPVFAHGFDMVSVGLLFIVSLGTLVSFAAAWSAIQRYLESTDARDFI